MHVFKDPSIQIEFTLEELKEFSSLFEDIIIEAQANFLNNDDNYDNEFDIDNYIKTEYPHLYDFYTYVKKLS